MDVGGRAGPVKATLQIGTAGLVALLVRVSWYFFHLIGEQAAESIFSEPLASDEEARRFASFLASHFQDCEPDICLGGYISVTNARGDEIGRIPLTSLH